MNMTNQLPKIVLITGAYGGIGQAITSKFITNGVKVILLDIDVTKLANTEQDFVISVQKCDLTKIDEIKKVWSYLDKCGIKVDCLINNAGVYFACPWQEYSFELASKVINVNVLGAFFMSQEFAHRNQQGSIVNISSIAGFTGGGDPVYGASKAALLGLTKSLALSLAPGIRVNAIAPGIVDTAMMKSIPQEILQHYHDHELLSELIKPEAIADVVLFLASNLSKNITGATIDINNGVYLR